MRFTKWAIAIAMTMVAGPAMSAEWREARSQHFIVYIRADQAEARRFATQLEQFDAGLRTLHDIEPQSSDANPLTVYVVDDVGDVQQLCAGTGGSCPAMAGFYLARVSGAIAITPRKLVGWSGANPRSVLFHEYSHHFQLAFAPFAYPAWFVEGFAEFNALAKLDKPGKVAFGIVPDANVKMLHFINGVPITKLLTVSPRDLQGEQVAYFYARSWLLTHYLTFERSRSGQLRAYLLALDAGKPNIEAATAAFGDLTKLERDLDAYLRRGRVDYVEVTVGELGRRGKSARSDAR